MFVGEEAYKTNAFLQFKVGFTRDRFLKDKFMRNFYSTKAFLSVSLFFWFLMLLLFGTQFNFMEIAIYSLNICSHGIAYKMLKVKYSNLKVRFILTINHIFFTYFLIVFLTSAFLLIIAIFHLPTFLSGNNQKLLKSLYRSSSSI